jgi:hypothetical protein
LVIKKKTHMTQSPILKLIENFLHFPRTEVNTLVYVYGKVIEFSSFSKNRSEYSCVCLWEGNRFVLNNCRTVVTRIV